MREKSDNKKFLKENERGQVTIFIIIAIVIVAGIAIFFIVRGGISLGGIPANIQPVYNTFLSCLEDKTRTGIDLLESQGGYIELPEFEPGSVHMPFSSQLNFLGNPIPYWYYVSANNVQKEQMPSEQDMETALENFINDRIRECDFASYYQEGFEIVQRNPNADVDIRNSDVNVKLNMNMEITRGEDNVLVTNHEINVNSNLGALYSSARTLYQKEQRELFLEDYAVDNIRLYAPVDGVEITCSPKTWNTNEVFSNLQDAIETNTLALTTATPTTNDGRYFHVDAGISQNARFINSRSWAYSLEVLPSQESLLIANPVGNQQGLGVLGFCYVPYHFVYNVKYPVLVQIYEGDETFQFPVAVVIQGNQPREPLTATAETLTPELCPYKNTQATIRTYDTNLNPVNSLVSYECFGESCAIGNTESGILTAEFPQCNNGYVVARAEGYEETRSLFSTIQEGSSATIVMNRLYDLDVALKLNGNDYNGNAFIYFISDDNSKTISYPEQKSIELSEGTYEVSVYIYRDSSLQLKEATHQECVDVPSSGIGGLFGATEKNCFDVKIPSQLVTNVLAGGGKQEYYAAEGSLSSSDIIEINAQQFTTPTTVEQLQNNYLSFDNSGLDITLR